MDDYCNNFIHGFSNLLENFRYGIGKCDVNDTCSEGVNDYGPYLRELARNINNLSVTDVIKFNLDAINSGSNNDESIISAEHSRASAYYNKLGTPEEHYLKHFSVVVPFNECEYCCDLKNHFDSHGKYTNRRLLFDPKNKYCGNRKYIAISQISDINEFRNAANAEISTKNKLFPIKESNAEVTEVQAPSDNEINIVSSVKDAIENDNPTELNESDKSDPEPEVIPIENSKESECSDHESSDHEDKPNYPTEVSDVHSGRDEKSDSEASDLSDPLEEVEYITSEDEIHETYDAFDGEDAVDLQEDEVGRSVNRQDGLSLEDFAPSEATYDDDDDDDEDEDEEEGEEESIFTVGEVNAVVVEELESEMRLANCKCGISFNVSENELISNAHLDTITSFHVSRDKIVTVAGTKLGYLNLWSFSDEVVIDENDNFKDDGTVNMLSWGMLSNAPHSSAKAHDGDIISVHVSSSEHSNEISHIITTVGNDMCVNVWGLRGKRLVLLSNKCFGPLVPIHAANIPNSNNVIVTSDGRIEMWEYPQNKGIEHTKCKKTPSMEKTDIFTETCRDICYGSLSPSGKYYAVGSVNGLINLYKVEKLKHVGSFHCKNRKGRYSEGRAVSGIDWTKDETKMCITTLDSRIRLLSTVSVDRRLPYLEKFKGHKNVKTGYSANFFGDDDGFIICPSENSTIIIWYSKSSTEDEGVIKNRPFAKFKSSRSFSRFLSVYNAGEWKCLLKHIKDYQFNYGDFTNIYEGCLGLFIREYNVNIDELDVFNDVLLVTSHNGHELLFTKI